MQSFAKDCVYWQHFIEVFLSPGSNTLYTVMYFTKWWSHDWANQRRQFSLPITILSPITNEPVYLWTVCNVLLSSNSQWAHIYENQRWKTTEQNLLYTVVDWVYPKIDCQSELTYSVFFMSDTASRLFWEQGLYLTRNSKQMGLEVKENCSAFSTSASIICTHMLF